MEEAEEPREEGAVDEAEEEAEVMLNTVQTVFYDDY